MNNRQDQLLIYMFTRADFPVKCNKHQLSIDADTRRDVRCYVRDRLNDIGAKHLGVATGTWPASHHFDRLVKIDDGLFALATAMLNYVGDVTFASPARCLRVLLAFITRADDFAVDNPLKTLDLLYSRILEGVPPAELPVTKLLLYAAFFPPVRFEDTQTLASFLRLEQNEFYAAMRFLHAVIDVPSAEDAAKRLPQMYCRRCTIVRRSRIISPTLIVPALSASGPARG
jgi:hypothetical protein